MAWPKGKPRKVVGGEVRSDAEPADVQQSWKTDVVEGQDPDFAYQFMRENEVRDRSRGKFVFDRRLGEQVRVSPWTVVQEEEVQVSRERPDLATPVDTTMRMGPHVLMKIPRKDWELLQHEKDAVPDGMLERFTAGKYNGEDSNDKHIRMKADKFVAHPGMAEQEGA